MPVPTDAPKNNEELSTNVSGVEWVEQMAQSLQSPHDTPDGLGSNRRRVISQGQHYSVCAKENIRSHAKPFYLSRISRKGDKVLRVTGKYLILSLHK